MRGCHDRDPMVVGFITTYAISSDEVCSIQHNVIEFVNDLAQVSGFLDISVSSINKIDCHDIIEILLKVALNTINLNLTLYFLERKTISKCKPEELIHTKQIVYQAGIL